MQGFEYSTEPHVRRHAPEGYADYESYRDWVRDEFLFRCVYCLHREQWYDRGATFNIDHFVPVSADPTGALEYTNLLYSCATCNNAKRSVLGVPDPCSVAFADCVCIRDDGNIDALNDTGRSLVMKLRLDSPKNTQHRSRWMRVLRVVQTSEPDLYRELMAFPNDLPDLRRLKPPRNTMPTSADNCHFAMRERGELPTTY